MAPLSLKFQIALVRSYHNVGANIAHGEGVSNALPFFETPVYSLFKNPLARRNISAHSTSREFKGGTNVMPAIYYSMPADLFPEDNNYSLCKASVN